MLKFKFGQINSKIWMIWMKKIFLQALQLIDLLDLREEKILFIFCYILLEDEQKYHKENVDLFLKALSS